MTPSPERSALPGRRLAVVLAVAVCMLPLVRMTELVLEGSPLQYSDYWLLVDEYTYDDGGLRVAGLFDFDVQNHPVVVPMVAYWLDFQLFAGSNIALGLFVVLLGVTLVVVIGLFLRRSPLPLAGQLAILVLSAYLVFSANGTWNYVKSMSGTAWLGASLVTLLAIHLRSRDRHVLAFLAASVAVITYATGLMAWTGIVATGLCRRRPRAWWREWPYAVGFALSYRFYQEAQSSGLAARVPRPPLSDLVGGTARLYGVPLGLRGGVALAVGLVAMVSTIGLVVWFAVRGPSVEAARWAGIATFGMTATATLAAGRPFVGDSSNNRYSSVPSLAMIGLAGLLGVALSSRPSRPSATPSSWPSWLPLTALCSVLALLTLVAGRDHVADMRQEVHEQELREVALRLDRSDGTRMLLPIETVDVTDLLRDNDQHPFVDGWDLDCGLLDRRVDPEVLSDDDPGGGTITVARQLTRVMEISGRLADPDAARCVVIADETGTVIGAGTIGYFRTSKARGTAEDAFVALAPLDAGAYRVVSIQEDGAQVLVGVVASDGAVGRTP